MMAIVAIPLILSQFAAMNATFSFFSFPLFFKLGQTKVYIYIYIYKYKHISAYRDRLTEKQKKGKRKKGERKCTTLKNLYKSAISVESPGKLVIDY